MEEIQEDAMEQDVKEFNPSVKKEDFTISYLKLVFYSVLFEEPLVWCIYTYTRLPYSSFGFSV